MEENMNKIKTKVEGFYIRYAEESDVKLILEFIKDLAEYEKMSDDVIATEELLKELEDKGVIIAYLTLHIGLGTFRPVREDNVENHKMHSEYCEIEAAEADKINKVRENGGRIIALGTTCVRTLESFNKDGKVYPVNAETDIFILPGHKFQMVDGLITNFHLPESTLIMLVSAFAGREFVLKAYETAVREKYRFFSFGDAMLIL